MSHSTPKRSTAPASGTELPRQAQGCGCSADLSVWTALSLAADQGHLGAQYSLGNMYANGMGVNKRVTAEAERWFRLAADRGYTFAQYRLGRRYSNSGQDVSRDNVEAHMWLTLAAAQSGQNLREQIDVRFSAGPQALDYLVRALTDRYVTTRDAVAERMTPEQLAEAQRRVREWTPTLEL